MKQLVNIIIFGYGPKLKKQDKACINSILFNTKHPYVLTYFDNYKRGMSLTQGWNYFIEKTKEDYILLLNNDTVVTENWLSKLVDVFSVDDSILFVGPSGNCHSPQKQIKSEEEAKKYDGEIELFDENHKHLSGFCLLFKRSVWENLGGFDEKFPLYGSESKFMQDAREKLGAKFAWRKDVFIYHIGEQSTKTYNLNTKKEREIARSLYWGGRKGINK